MSENNWVQGLTSDIVPKLLLAGILSVSGTAAYQLRELNFKVNDIVLKQALGDRDGATIRAEVSRNEAAIKAIDRELLLRTQNRFTATDAKDAFDKITDEMEAAFTRVDRILSDHEERIRKNERSHYSGGGGK